MQTLHKHIVFLQTHNDIDNYIKALKVLWDDITGISGKVDSLLKISEITAQLNNCKSCNL